MASKDSSGIRQEAGTQLDTDIAEDSDLDPKAGRPSSAVVYGARASSSQAGVPFSILIRDKLGIELVSDGPAVAKPDLDVEGLTHGKAGRDKRTLVTERGHTRLSRYSALLGKGKPADNSRPMFKSLVSMPKAEDDMKDQSHDVTWKILTHLSTGKPLDRLFHDKKRRFNHAESGQNPLESNHKIDIADLKEEAEARRIMDGLHKRFLQTVSKADSEEKETSALRRKPSTAYVKRKYKTMNPYISVSNLREGLLSQLLSSPRCLSPATPLEIRGVSISATPSHITSPVPASPNRKSFISVEFPLAKTSENSSLGNSRIERKTKEWVSIGSNPVTFVQINVKKPGTSFALESKRQTPIKSSEIQRLFSSKSATFKEAKVSKSRGRNIFQGNKVIGTDQPGVRFLHEPSQQKSPNHFLHEKLSLRTRKRSRVSSSQNLSPSSVSHPST